MQRTDYLNPSELKCQCAKAANRLEEDQRALETVYQSIGRFAGDSEIESTAFDTLKQQLADYQLLIEGCRLPMMRMRRILEASAILQAVKCWTERTYSVRWKMQII